MNTPTREEVAEITKLAQALVDNHEQRSSTSQYATLGELDALFNLRFQLNALMILKIENEKDNVPVV